MLIGCVMMAPGFFGGGMIGALVAKVVGSMRGCAPAEGYLACDVWAFVVPGGLIGIVLLPTLVLWRLRRGGGQGNSSRS
jgi:hypothetical protein